VGRRFESCRGRSASSGESIQRPANARKQAEGCESRICKLRRDSGYPAGARGPVLVQSENVSLTGPVVGPPAFATWPDQGLSRGLTAASSADVDVAGALPRSSRARRRCAASCFSSACLVESAAIWAARRSAPLGRGFRWLSGMRSLCSWPPSCPPVGRCQVELALRSGCRRTPRGSTSDVARRRAPAVPASRWPCNPRCGFGEPVSSGVPAWARIHASIAGEVGA